MLSNAIIRFVHKTLPICVTVAQLTLDQSVRVQILDRQPNKDFGSNTMKLIILMVSFFVCTDIAGFAGLVKLWTL